MMGCVEWVNIRKIMIKKGWKSGQKGIKFGVPLELGGVQKVSKMPKKVSFLHFFNHARVNRYPTFWQKTGQKSDPFLSNFWPTFWPLFSKIWLIWQKCHFCHFWKNAILVIKNGIFWKILACISRPRRGSKSGHPILTKMVKNAIFDKMALLPKVVKKGCSKIEPFFDHIFDQKCEKVCFNHGG